ncbi:flagellar motor switch protein FliN [Pseudomonas sp. PLMAX]|jgi:flagellar motor switch protein FliN/FliY|uniref:flagellar motor switch protein FliN n=1 Tax=Pseudomonas sp. PLMAX TaxID=2201998 RepID=UPI0038B7D65F
MTDINQTSGEQAEVDPWAEAMNEQAAATQSDAAKPADPVFKALEDTGGNKALARTLDMIKDIPVTMSPILGKKKMTIKELLELSPGSVVQLDAMAGSPLVIMINNYEIAKGEVVVVNEHYGIRITEILTPSERMQNLIK